MHEVNRVSAAVRIGRELVVVLLMAMTAACGGAAATSTGSRSPNNDRGDGAAPERKTGGKPRRPPRDRDETTVVTVVDDEPRAVGAIQRGVAVWYGANWHGKPTASGERFNRYKMTAAHRTLPMGTMVRVRNERNGATIVVRINDRGPYGKRRQRIIDVSEAGARVLGIIDAGTCPVAIEVLSLPATREKRR